ncbi:MAG: CbiQ family ECF transporter T component [Jaaginema sp. PMC 1079.18]|nr:CbiQ family ECF transporter T component [Jaaginema sp. PMC 1080.18]MEC4852077.1 CbiQ family ECF transporter T component [Jaaginema sp. PMC 1079.18]MEC4867257.1 CbiQ family ECF transporter T component [Jaaginema sp. PMC 1078.18]
MDLLRSLPIGLYLEQPFTWLHRLDPRVKLAWLMSFLFAPVWSSTGVRLGLVVLLMAISLSARIPWRALKQQMGWLLLLGTFAFIFTAIAPDGLAIAYQPRLPLPETQLPQPDNYQYILYQFRRITITRRSLDLALRLGSLLFTLIYSTSLYLLTTAPEEITAALDDLLRPLARFKVPVTEIILTLTLSLRFIPLVLEEVQNLIRSVNTRAIEWKKLGLRKSAQVWLIIVERILKNLLLRSEQIATAMDVRGFTEVNRHRVQWHILRLHRLDWVMLGLLPVFWWVRVAMG